MQLSPLLLMICCRNAGFNPTGRWSSRVYTCVVNLRTTRRLQVVANSTLTIHPIKLGRPCSIVGIATYYGLDGPGIESRCGRDFRTCPDRSWGPPILLYNGYRVFPGVKSGRCVTLTPHPLLVPWSRESRAIPLPPPLHGPYRASVSVQGRTLPFTCD